MKETAQSAVRAWKFIAIYYAIASVTSCVLWAPLALGQNGLLDAAVAQHHAAVWLVMCALCQFGVVIALFSLLRFGAEADRLVRFASRGAVATFLSFVTTLVVGLMIFEMLNLLRLHSR